MTYKRAPHSQTSPDTLDVLLETGEHAPLTRERHAEIVAYFLRHNHAAWRVLFEPTNYIYDERDQRTTAELELDASELRVRFNSETDWCAAVEIVRKLLQIDASCCRMSIGSRIDGRDYYGDYAGADAR